MEQGNDPLACRSLGPSRCGRHVIGRLRRGGRRPGQRGCDHVGGNPTATRTGYADVESGRIYYQVYGDLNSGKTPLLVLHGSFMSGDAMRPFVAPFAAGRPVIAIDARGHGRSGEFPGPISYELMADDAAAVLAALNVRSADVLGYSMGGTTALFMAVRHPDRVGKQIILAGTSRRDGWYPEVLQAMAQATPAMFAGTPIEAEYRRLSPNPDQFPTFVEEVTGLEAQNYASLRRRDPSDRRQDDDHHRRRGWQCSWSTPSSCSGCAAAATGRPRRGASLPARRARGWRFSRPPRTSASWPKRGGSPSSPRPSSTIAARPAPRASSRAWTRLPAPPPSLLER